MRLAAWIAALAAAAATPAQGNLGQAARLEVGEWVRGKPPRIGTPTEPGALVALFFFRPDLFQQRSWLPLLNRVQRRFAARDVEVAAVAVTGNFEAVEKCLKRYGDVELRVARGPRARSLRAYAGGYAVIQRRDGRLVWRGSPNRLADALKDQLDGTDSIDYGRQAERSRRVLSSRRPAEQLRHAEDLIGLGPERALGWVLRVRGVRAGQNPETLKETVIDALSTLARRPGECVEFVRKAGLHAEKDAELKLRVLTALRRLLRKGHDDPELHYALAEVAEACGRRQMALRACTKFVDHPGVAGTQLLWLIGRQGAHKDAAAFSGPIRAAIRRLSGELDGLMLLRVCFKSLAACKAPVDEARAVGRKIIPLLEGDDTELNNFAWYTMVDVPWKGRFDALALEAAERIGKKTGAALSYYALDTFALAKFRNGLVDEAIALQKKALELSKGSRPGYKERLEQYRAAKAAKKETGK